MKHIAFGGIAALIAAVITVSLHFYGAHDIQGFFAVVAGYPGMLASRADERVNQVLFTAVNWLFYLLLIEVAFALKRKFSKAASPRRQS